MALLLVQMKSDWLWFLEASCKNLTVFPPVLKWKGKKESIKGVWFSNKPDFQFIWRALYKGYHEPVSHQMFSHIFAVVYLTRTQTKPHKKSPHVIFVIIPSQADNLQIAPVPSSATNWGAILRNSLVLLALQFASCHVVIMPFSFQHNLLLPKWCMRAWYLLCTRFCRATHTSISQSLSCTSCSSSCCTPCITHRDTGCLFYILANDLLGL